MRILQVTDLHIGQADELPFDVDVRQNFQQILEQIQDCTADALMISGDLCYQDGDPGIYAWIKQQLAALSVPYYLIPGNHDDTKMMAEAFDIPLGPNGTDLYYEIADSPVPCFCLDSGVGTISADQLQWLSLQLESLNERILLFVHHPPMPMGVPYMDDNHALQNGTDLCEVLTAYGHPVDIFTGHYHVDKSRSFQNIQVHITPSCFFQIDWRLPDFGVAHHRIAYRDIQLTSDGLTHGLIWC